MLLKPKLEFTIDYSLTKIQMEIKKLILKNISIQIH